MKYNVPSKEGERCDFHLTVKVQEVTEEGSGRLLSFTESTKDNVLARARPKRALKGSIKRKAKKSKRRKIKPLKNIRKNKKSNRRKNRRKNLRKNQRKNQRKNRRKNRPKIKRRKEKEEKPQSFTIPETVVLTVCAQ
jgi:hypothetical protein